MKAVSWTESDGGLLVIFLDSPLRIFCSIGWRLEGSVDSIGIDGIHIELNCILRASAIVFLLHTLYMRNPKLSISISTLNQFTVLDETCIFTSREDLTRATTTSHCDSTFSTSLSSLEVRHQHTQTQRLPALITINTSTENVRRTLEHSPRRKCRRLSTLKEETLHPTRYVQSNPPTHSKPHNYTPN